MTRTGQDRTWQDEARRGKAGQTREGTGARHGRASKVRQGRAEKDGERAGKNRTSQDRAV